MTPAEGMLTTAFFDRPCETVARDLIGKVIRRRLKRHWLSAAIVETEAYGDDKASHSYLGKTPSREPMWAAPGTIYMYHSRGGASLNFSVAGAGHAVLIKAARPWSDHLSGQASLAAMHRLNPGPRARRPDHKLLAGQGLLARALGLTVADWNGAAMDAAEFFLCDAGYRPTSILCARRLGIPEGRDEGLMRRYVDADHAKAATQNPLTRRTWVEGVDFTRV